MAPKGFEGVSPNVLDAWRRAHLERTLEDPGPDWLTMTQLSRIFLVSFGQTCKRIKMLGDRVERSRRQIINARGLLVFIPVYRLKPLKTGGKDAKAKKGR